MAGDARDIDEQLLQATALRIRPLAALESITSEERVTIALSVGGAILAAAAVGAGNVAVLVAIGCLFIVSLRCARLQLHP